MMVVSMVVRLAESRVDPTVDCSADDLVDSMVVRLAESMVDLMVDYLADRKAGWMVD